MDTLFIKKFLIAAGLITVVIWGLPSYVLSADVSGRSRTFLSARETVFEEHIIRLYEYVDLDSYNISDKGISLHASGWGRYDLDSPSEDDRDEGELSYAYLVVPVESLNARFQLGRQFIFAGAASEQVDGLSLTTGISGVEATLFGGSPPELDIDDRKGDAIYGGRLSHHMDGLYEVGVSYLKEQNDTEDFREEYGADLWLMPVSWLSLQGASTYNEVTSGWMEHTFRLNVGSADKIRVYGEYSAIDYEHFFQASTTTVFSTVWVDPEESYTASEGGIEFVLSGHLNITARYKQYTYEQAGNANSYGGGLTYMGNVVTAGFSCDRMDGDIDELAYTMYRAFLSASGEKADLTLDISQAKYDVDQGGTDETLTATGAIGYRPVKGLRAGIEVTYEENPLFDHETRGLLKVDYRFGAI